MTNLRLTDYCSETQNLFKFLFILNQIIGGQNKLNYDKLYYVNKYII